MFRVVLILLFTITVFAKDKNVNSHNNNTSCDENCQTNFVKNCQIKIQNDKMIPNKKEYCECFFTAFDDSLPSLHKNYLENNKSNSKFAKLPADKKSFDFFVQKWWPKIEIFYGPNCPKDIESWCEDNGLICDTIDDIYDICNPPKSKK